MDDSIPKPDGITRLFVYGSLKPREWNYRLIEEYVHQAVPGTVSGRLVDLGSFPALVPGRGIVQGVMLEVDEAALVITDRLEGVPHLYRRQEVSVTFTNGGQHTAWTYEYADHIRIADRPLLLVDHIKDVPVYAWRNQ